MGTSKSSGSRSKFLCTDEMVDDIVSIVSNGLSNNDACKYVGISRETLYRWLENPRTDAEKRLKREMSQCEVMRKQWHMSRIQDAAEHGYWQASAWYMERKYPKEWSRPEVQLGVKNEKRSVSNDGLSQALRSMAERFEGKSRTDSDMIDDED